MTRKRPSPLEEPRRLGDLLRSADPAADSEGPTAAEAAAVRRRILDAAGKTGASRRLRWAAAAAAVAICLAGAWQWLGDRTSDGASSPVRVVATTPVPPSATSRADRVATVEEGTRTPDLAAATSEDEIGGVTPQPDSTEAETTQPRPAAVRTSGSEISDPATSSTAAAEPDRIAAREVRFETEMGTRIVWIFDNESDHEAMQGATS